MTRIGKNQAMDSTGWTIIVSLVYSCVFGDKHISFFIIIILHRIQSVGSHIAIMDHFTRLS